MSTAGDAFRAAAARPLVVSDIDGVVAFFAEAVATAVNARFGTALLAHQFTTWRIEDMLPREQADWVSALCKQPRFYANLAPDLAAAGALAAMRTAGLHVAVSSDRDVSVREATTAWLDRWGVERDELHMDGPGSKDTLLAGYGPDRPAVLIDDSPVKWLTLARPGVQVWTPARPWTPGNWAQYRNVWVFDSWAQVLDRLGIDQMAGCI